MWQTSRTLGMGWWICAIVDAMHEHFSRLQLQNGTGPRHLYHFRYTSSCLSRHCCCRLSFLQQQPRIVAAACSSSAAEVSRRDVALCVAVLQCVVQERSAEVRVMFALLAVVSICHRHHRNYVSRLRRVHLQHVRRVYLQHLRQCLFEDAVVRVLLHCHW